MSKSFQASIRRSFVLVAIVGQFLIESAVFGTTWHLPGVNSPILVGNDRVAFVQAYDGITVLDLETGAVCARADEDRAYPDHETFEKEMRALETHPGYVNLFYDARLVSPTMHNAAERIRPRDGRACELSAGVQGGICYSEAAEAMTWWPLITEGWPPMLRGDRLIIHRRNYRTNYEYEDSTIFVIDAISGEILIEKKTGFSCFHVCVDETRIYLLCGDSANTLRDTRIWDFKGNEVGRLNAPEGTSTLGYSMPSCLRVGEFFFYSDGSVTKRDESGIELAPQFGRYPLLRPEDPSNPDAEFKLAHGTLRLASQAEPVSIHYKSSDGEWFGCFPYLYERKGIVALTEYEGKLLVGSNSGHLECIDLATGGSLWVYAFPILDWRYLPLMSDPGWRGDAAAAWHKSNRLALKTIGMVRLDKAALDEAALNNDQIDWKEFRDTFRGSVTLDPMPSDRYRNYYRSALYHWIPVVCLFAAMFLGPKRGPKWVRIPLFIVAWVTSILGVVAVFFFFYSGGIPLFSQVHALAWVVGSVLFPIMLYLWRISNWDREST